MEHVILQTAAETARALHKTAKGSYAKTTRNITHTTHKANKPHTT